MKKLSYLSGYFAALAAVTAVVFKIHHLDFVSTIITIAFIIMSIYFPLYILFKNQDVDGKISPANVGAASSAFIITIGILFKLNHWPYAALLLTVGILLFSLIFVPLLFIQKSKLPGSNNLVNGTGALGLSLFALGLLFKFQHWFAQMPLLIAGAVLVVLIYLPLKMLSEGVAEKKEISHLQNTFFVIIISCLLIMLAWGMIGMHLLPPETTP
jgi:hypothetical protein